MTAKTDVMVKLVLVFFISLLSFSIGTFVGKKYSDNQHKLAQLEPGHGKSNRQVASIVDEGGKAEGTMSDDEIAKIAEEFADDAPKTDALTGLPMEIDNHGEKVESHDAHATPAQDHSATAKKTTAHPAPSGDVAAKTETKAHAASAHTASHDEPSAPAKNVAQGKQPTESIVKKAKAETRLPSSLPKDVAQYSVGKFTVQIGAFGTETEAKTRAEELKGKGYSAFYIPASVKGKTWYRVSVGLFASEQEAKDYRVKFMEKANIENTLIQKIAN